MVHNFACLPTMQVFSFSSWRPQQQAAFVRITTEGNKTVLVTPSHYMFTATDNGPLDPNVHHWSYVPAKMLKPGNIMATFSGSTISPARIKDISIEDSWNSLLHQLIELNVKKILKLLITIKISNYSVREIHGYGRRHCISRTLVSRLSSFQTYSTWTL